MRQMLLCVLLLVGCKSETPLEEIPEPEEPHLALVIDEPAPASWLDIGTVAVAGRYDNVSGILVDGGAATAADGTFGAETELEHGMNLIEVSGVSPGGTTYSTHNGVIAGPTADPDEPVPGAANVRLNKDGLDIVLGMAGSLIDGPTIEATLLAGNPVYESDKDGTQITVNATRFALGGTSIAATPGEGTAALTIVLTNLELGVDVNARSGSFWAEVSQEARIRKATITGTLGLTVTDGVIATTLTDVDVVLEGFTLDTSEWPSWLTGQLTDMILTELVEGVLRVVVADMVPPVLDEQLNSLDLSVATTIMDRPLTVGARIADAAFDPAGLALLVDLDVTIDGLGSVDAPGYLAAPSSATASPDTTAPMSLGLADDLLNLVMFEAWRGGVLKASLSTEDGTLPPYVLDAVGGARNGLVQIEAQLPPTIVEKDGRLRAQVGEIRVRLDTIEGRYGSYVILAIGGHVDLDLTVDDGLLKIGFADKDLKMTVRDTDWSESLPRAAEQVEKLVPVELALALLKDLEFPLPSFAGLTISGATVARDASGVHTNIAVTVAPAEE